MRTHRECWAERWLAEGDQRLPVVGEQIAACNCVFIYNRA
jgi:hypothetical protein